MKTILIFSVLIVWSTASFAARKIEGQIILRNHETIRVTFLLPFKLLSSEPDYVRLQYKVRYLLNNKKQVLRPQEAKEISFTLNGQKIRMLSVHDNLAMGSVWSSRSEIFLKLERDGTVKIFSYFQTTNSPGMYNASTGMTTGGATYTTERMVFQKNNGELFRPRSLAFKKDMASFFSDCPELVDKIEEKEFRRSDLEAMVMYYNQHCGR